MIIIFVVFFPFQHVLPVKAVHKLCGPLVRELTVAEPDVASVTEQGNKLHKLEINTVDRQWLQVCTEK